MAAPPMVVPSDQMGHRGTTPGYHLDNTEGDQWHRSFISLTWSRRVSMLIALLRAREEDGFRKILGELCVFVLLG